VSGDTLQTYSVAANVIMQTVCGEHRFMAETLQLADLLVDCSSALLAGLFICMDYF